LIDSAGASMNDVKAVLDASLNAVSQISHALQEQREASEDVARNVETVAQRVEENVAAQQDVVKTIQALKGCPVNWRQPFEALPSNGSNRDQPREVSSITQHKPLMVTSSNPSLASSCRQSWRPNGWTR
jgi:hypothetical protein